MEKSATKKCEEVVAALLRYQGFARYAECAAACKQKRLPRPGHAIWNLEKAGRLNVIERGLYGWTPQT
jgi:hypothetical protein